MDKETEMREMTEEKETSKVVDQQEKFPGPDLDKAQKLNLYYAPRLCPTCNVWKPPRSHHDSITNRCVLRMDHYCPFTGNVIGARNHGHFVLMYAFSFLGLFYALFIIFTTVYWTHFVGPGPDASEMQRTLYAEQMKVYHDNYVMVEHAFHELKGFRVALSTIGKVCEAGLMVLINLVLILGIDAVIFLCLSIFFTIVVSMCGGYAIFVCTQNVTSLEWNLPNLNEYVEIWDQVFCPIGPMFYKQPGKFPNFKMVLGKNWWQRIVFPYGGNVDLIELGYEMPCSPDAVEQLHWRIQQWHDEGSRLPEKSYQELGITPPDPSSAPMMEESVAQAPGGV